MMGFVTYTIYGRPLVCRTGPCPGVRGPEWLQDQSGRAILVLAPLQDQSG